MTPETFTNRIERGLSNHFTYSDGEKNGLISVWKHEKDIVLTWEECPKGEQLNENTYTRDERHLFSTIEELLAFFAMHDLEMTCFTT